MPDNAPGLVSEGERGIRNVKWAVNIIGGRIQEPEFGQWVRSRKDGEYWIEMRGQRKFEPRHRARVHAMMRAVEKHTGTSIEEQKRDHCEAIGHGKYTTRPVIRDGELVGWTQSFQRFPTEALEYERYVGEFISRVEMVMAFLEIKAAPF
jgi:hypothetical protein